MHWITLPRERTTFVECQNQNIRLEWILRYLNWKKPMHWKIHIIIETTSLANNEESLVVKTRCKKWSNIA